MRVTNKLGQICFNNYVYLKSIFLETDFVWYRKHIEMINRFNLL